LFTGEQQCWPPDPATGENEGGSGVAAAGKINGPLGNIGLPNDDASDVGERPNGKKPGSDGESGLTQGLDTDDPDVTGGAG